MISRVANRCVGGSIDDRSSYILASSDVTRNDSFITCDVIQEFCLRGNYTKITICQVPFYKQLPQLWRTYLIVRMAVSSKPSDYNANLKRKTFTVRILETRFISILSLFYKNKSISIV